MPGFLDKRKESAAQIEAQKAALEEERKQQLLKLRLETLGPIRTQPDELGEGEKWWRDHYHWLHDAGYTLRSRYHPEWVPSWKTRNVNWIYCEDAIVQARLANLMDATRTSDGRFVAIKRLEISRHPFELAIAQYLYSENLRTDPENHTVPIYDILYPPDAADYALLMMPLLLPYSTPPFETVGEVVELFRQVFEGLRFMHKKHVAHRDCMRLNIMMDGEVLYDEPFHPVRPYRKRDFSGLARHRTRTERPPKYFFIDFGISRRYDVLNKEPQEDPIWGGDQTVPEFQHSNRPRNPFPTDVYYIGNMVREDFMQQKIGFEFMAPLINDMVQDDPNKRPTMDEVVTRFEDIRKVSAAPNYGHALSAGTRRYLMELFVMLRIGNVALGLS
ncbi:hypothetical protein BU15DRAFT_55077 [Melanogaster broomeanus]|nr:hypothetical protein BU15DRAFT_55077 [Melanogaster broomeanus]